MLRAVRPLSGLGQVSGSGNSLKRESQAESLGTCLERGKMPISRQADLGYVPRGIEIYLVYVNRERELGLDRRETG